MNRCFLSVLPGGIRGEAERFISENTEEIRVRVGRPVLLRGRETVRLGHITEPEECEAMLELVCAHSLFAYEQELRGGYVTLEDGSRVGICGRLNPTGSVSLPGSFNVRIAREVKGAADGLVKMLRQAGLASALIISEPGVGKTTVLRDAARQLSQMGYQVGIADERGEIAAPVNGVPRLDVGANTDVVCGCGKGRAMELMIRAMAPEILITDEIATGADAAAALEAAGCGIRLICSAHAGSAEELRRREGLMNMVRCGVFDMILLLKRENGGRSLCDITAELI